MKTRYALLALLPACFMMPNLSASAHSLQDANSPELASERSKPIAIERSIKVPWLNVPKDDLPAMSESSAVRMACGGSFVGMYPQAPKPVRFYRSPAAQASAIQQAKSSNRATITPVRSVVTPSAGLVH